MSSNIFCLEKCSKFAGSGISLCLLFSWCLCSQNVVVGVEEGVARMCDSASRVFQCSSEALEHCLQLTSGWGYHGLQKALQVRIYRCSLFLFGVELELCQNT